MTDVAAQHLLADLTTLRLGGPARAYVAAASTEQLRDALRDAAGDVLVLGGGSNLVVADAGFDGTVVHVATRGLEVGAPDATGHVHVRIQAGEPWDEVVARIVADGLGGIESLSGIPGSTGATPIQNVGAYGASIADVLTRVEVLDRASDELRWLDAGACGFGYRTSRFKREPGRHVVTAIELRLTSDGLGAPVRYAELARALDVEPGTRAPVAEVREAVLQLRRGKGMVLDAADPDSRSAGSFFTNPILEPAAFEALVARADAPPPSWPEADGMVKTSAAWLIERAGFHKGYGAGAAGISSKHTLALVNRGGATTADLLAVARDVRDGVEAAFGVRLHPEPVLVGVTLD